MKQFSARETVWLQELDGIELAGFRRRAFAFVIDWAIVGLLLTVVLTLGTLAYVGIAKATGHGQDIHIEFGKGNLTAKLDDLDRSNGPRTDEAHPAAGTPAPDPATDRPSSDAHNVSKHNHVQFKRLHPEEGFFSEIGEEALKIFTDIVIPCLYFGLFFWRWNGQTPGKRWMKIRVVSLVHPHMTFWHSVERALGYGAAALEAGFGFIQYFIHPYRRCAQDRLAETIVVTERSWRATFPTPPQAPDEPTAF